MKRLAVLATMLALMLVAAAPASAATARGGDVNLLFVDCSQVQAAAATQTNEGDATAGDVASAAAIDQSLTIEQSQVNACVGGVAAGGNIFWWHPWWW
jgi:hypothetical protein